MKFADEAIKSHATRRSNSTWSSSGSAGCPAGKVERRLVMIGVRLPEEGGPVGAIFPPASFGNLLPELLAISPDNGWVVTGSDDTTAPQGVAYSYRTRRNIFGGKDKRIWRQVLFSAAVKERMTATILKDNVEDVLTRHSRPWGVKPKPGRSFASFLRARFLSFAMVALVMNFRALQLDESDETFPTR
jgi:hypothetical protein